MAVKQAAKAAGEIAHASLEERRARGRQAAEPRPRPAIPGGGNGRGPSQPGSSAEEQDRTREPDLVPVRHGRMMVSPFTFYRGAAKIMAADLKDTPRPGWTPSCAGTRTCPTSARSPPRSGRCCST